MLIIDCRGTRSENDGRDGKLDKCLYFFLDVRPSIAVLLSLFMSLLFVVAVVSVVLQTGVAPLADVLLVGSATIEKE